MISLKELMKKCDAVDKPNACGEDPFIEINPATVRELCLALQKAMDALEVIAAEHLEPLCPELFDCPVDTVLEDTKLSRETLQELREVICE